MSEKFKNSIVLCLLIAAFTLLPDLIYGLVNEFYRGNQTKKSVTISLAFALLIAFSKPNRFLKCIFLVMLFLQASQLMYFHYFGSFYSAFDILLALKEPQDALLGLFDIAFFLLIPLGISGITFFVVYYFWRKLSVGSFSHVIFNYLLLIVLCLPFLQSLNAESSQKFQPNVTHSAIRNGLYTCAYFTAYKLKQTLNIKNNIPDYKEYVVETISKVDANIVIIMGESLSSENMQLFGYHRKTTPRLSRLKGNHRFIYQQSISSAVSTRVSLALFYNTVYEPDNIAHIQSMDTALYRLAKQSGFNTHYITTQKNAGGLTYSFSLKDIDTWKDNSHLNHHPSHYDDRLLKELKAMNLDYSQPQFITLHMRSAHTPYIDNYPKEQSAYPVDGQSYTDYLLNSYDNSVLFNDGVIMDIFDFFDTTGHPTYIFFTADHGELTGQNGRFGHNQVDLDIANVPFLFYGANVSEKRVTALANDLGNLPNHYVISKKIAALLGYKITNPNEKNGKFYLNGTAVFGEAGFIEYDIKEVKKQYGID